VKLNTPACGWLKSKKRAPSSALFFFACYLRFVAGAILSNTPLYGLVVTFNKSGRHRVGVYEEATIPALLPADPTDPGDAADLSTPQGILLFRLVVCRHGQI
jgi:hypothetical protein